MKSKIESPSYSRKDFLRTAGSVTLFAALGITVTSCGSPTDPNDDNVTPGPNPPPSNSTGIVIEGNKITINLSISANSGLKNSGGWLLISQAQTIVVNVDGNLIRAFSSVCTHQGCATSWQFSAGVFECTCHGSKFNTAGQVVRGPAATNLPEYATTRSGDTVVIQK